MNNINSSFSFKDGNYFTNDQMTAGKAEKILSNLPVGSWLVRPSSQPGVMTLTWKEKDIEERDTYYNHRVRSTDILISLIREKHLEDKNYVGPNQLEPEKIDSKEQQRKTYKTQIKDGNKVIHEKQDRFYPAQAKAWLKSIEVDHKQLAAYCQENPKDCKKLYDQLESVSQKLTQLIEKGATEIKNATQMEKIAKQAKKMAEIFREIEKSTVNEDVLIEEAMPSTLFSSEINSSFSFKNGNYFTSDQMTVGKAEKILSTLPVGSWLVRPSSQPGVMTLTWKETGMYYNHRVRSTEDLISLIKEKELEDQNYIGPNQLEPEKVDAKEQQKKTYKTQIEYGNRVINEKQSRFYPAQVKTWLKSIEVDRKQLVAHCRENPQDCKKLYDELESASQKLSQLIQKGATEIKNASKMEKIAKQAKEMAEIFREIERSTTNEGLLLEEAMLIAPFSSGDIHLPPEIRDLIHKNFFTSSAHTNSILFNEENLHKLRNFYTGTTQKQMYPILGEVLSSINESASRFSYLRDNEIQGVVPFLTSLSMSLPYGHLNKVSEEHYNFFKKFARECSNLKHISSVDTATLKILKNPQRLTSLEIIATNAKNVGKIDFSDIDHTFSSLQRLKISVGNFGAYTEEELSKIHSDSINTLEIAFDLNFGEFTISKSLAEEWIKNLPELKEIIIPSNSRVNFEEGVVEMFAKKNIKMQMPK